MYDNEEHNILGENNFRSSSSSSLKIDLLCYNCNKSPVGPYYKSGFKPIRLQSENSYVRAWPGGTGNSKVGGNYAPAMKPAAEAAQRGYEQVLWLLDDEITEVGAMNVFFLWIDAKTGRKELVTPPLDRGDILPGVTRQSVIELAKS